MDPSTHEPEDRSTPSLDAAPAFRDTSPSAHTEAPDEEIRALLAAVPSPGPMPDDVSARILAALAQQAQARPATHQVPRSIHAPGARGLRPSDHAVLTPLLLQRQRPRPLLAAAAVAAAAVVVALGGSALHLRTAPAAPAGSAVAAVGRTPLAQPSTVPSSGLGAPPSVHIQLSETAYDPASLPGLARELLRSPGRPLRDLAAEAPALGPIATEIGLMACVGALDAPVPDAISADLATYAGEPAAVIVVTSEGTSTAYAVRRTCTTGAPEVLGGPTPLP